MNSKEVKSGILKVSFIVSHHKMSVTEFDADNNLYYITRILSVWHSIDSAPGRDTDLRPVSLEPA
jgi:hypothetical protein